MQLKRFTLEINFLANISEAEMENLTPAVAAEIFLEIKQQLRASLPQSHITPLRAELSSETVSIPDKVWEAELKENFDCWEFQGAVRDPLPEPTHTTPETVQ